MADTKNVEVIAVGDLAQAIVALRRAAERRKGAHAELVDATDTKAIRDQLRSGDQVGVMNEQGHYLAHYSKPGESAAIQGEWARRDGHRR
jgi:hypothetical protein